MTVDISELVKDGRLPPNTSIKVKGNELEFLFSNGRYKLLPESSELRDDGRTWALYFHADRMGMTAFCTKKYAIPAGVEKIVLLDTDF